MNKPKNDTGLKVVKLTNHKYGVAKPKLDSFIPVYSFKKKMYIDMQVLDLSGKHIRCAFEGEMFNVGFIKDRGTFKFIVLLK